MQVKQLSLAVGFLMMGLGASSGFGQAPPAIGGPARMPEEGCIPEHEWADIERRLPPSAVNRAGVDLAKLRLYPVAGIMGRDVLLNFYVDLSTGSGVQDWECTDHAYNGHNGNDLLIRTFGEQDIGVPVFAAADGLVLSAVDLYLEDHNVCDLPPAPCVGDNHSGGAGNHVVVDHGGGRRSLYWHLKKDSVLVSVDDQVRAGQQLASVGSSGHSGWPHLHLEMRDNNVRFEPHAGLCRPGETAWVSQLPIDRVMSVRELNMTGDYSNPMPQDFVRTGTYVLGEQTVGMYMIVMNLVTNATVQLTYRRPDSSIAHDEIIELGNPFYTMAWWWVGAYLNLDTVGAWSVSVRIEGTLVATVPFDVVATAMDIVNRPPEAISVSLDPPNPTQYDVVHCKVDTDLVLDDRDFDIVRYHYVWQVDSQVIRDVVSAAHADVIPHTTAPSGSSLECFVTPSDGQADGPTASASVVVLAGDCNHNGIPDDLDIADCPGNPECGDCNGNTMPDECEADCNENGFADDCDIAEDRSDDRDGNLIPDECQGACCICGSLCEVLAPGECAALAGSFGGLETICADPDVCQPPVSNDVCATAVPRPSDPAQTFPFNNLCATTDGPGAVQCPSLPASQFGTDLWYPYVAPCTGTLRVSMCEDTDFDAILAVYGGSENCVCPVNNTTRLTCEDDSCGVPGGPATVDVAVIEGNCYLIRAGGWAGATGTGTIELQYLTSCGSPPAPTTEPGGQQKSRFAAFIVPPPAANRGPGQQTALRVTLTTLNHVRRCCSGQDGNGFGTGCNANAPCDNDSNCSSGTPMCRHQLAQGPPTFPAMEGNIRYVNSFAGGSLVCADDGPPFDTSFRCATLGCDPEYRDWATDLGVAVNPAAPSGLVYITGDAMIPSSTMHVAHIAASCGAAPGANTCTAASAALSTGTSAWGDITSAAFGPPDGKADVLDIPAVTNKLKGVPTFFGEYRTWLKQRDPAANTDAITVVDLSDVQDGVLAKPYPASRSIDACPHD